MSSYLNFFVRSKNDEFTQIASYSRNHYIYDAYGAPYEKIALVTVDHIQSAIDDLGNRREMLEENIELAEEMIQYICSFPVESFTMLESKMNAINEQKELINEYKDDIKQVELARFHLSFIHDAIAMDGCHIYAGVEISNPTKEDIL